MLSIALKMMVGDRAKFLGILIGLVFASFIIIQQSGIFIGLMQRTYGFIKDTSQADIWVMDSEVKFVDDTKGMKNTQLFRVMGIEGVKWAVPLFKGLIKARLQSGNYEICNLIGIDNATLIGGPPVMVEGSLLDLRIPDAVIVNDVGAKDRLGDPDPNNPKRTIPLRVGEVLELNDNRSQVVGICQVGRTFRSEPVIYTTLSRAINFAPSERNQLTFILVKAQQGEDLNRLCARIRNTTGLAAYTNAQFKRLTVNYFITNTGILMNFGFAVFLGFLIGAAIAGQTFYNFAHDNLPYFATYKAMGAPRKLLTRMVTVQALMVGSVAWTIGLGLASLFGILTRGTELSFVLPWQLLIGSGIAVLAMTLGAAVISLWKILRLDPAIVFQT